MDQTEVAISFPDDCLPLGYDYESWDVLFEAIDA